MKSPSQVFSLRLPINDYAAILQAAKHAHESLSEYIRRAIHMRQENAPRPCTQVGYVVSVPGMTDAQLITWSENSARYDYEVIS